MWNKARIYAEEGLSLLIDFIAFAFFALIFLSLLTVKAHAAALTTWPSWVGSNDVVARSVTPAALIAKGIGTNAYYVLEVDPTTGALPVSASISSADDHNYGTVGATTLRSAAQIGNATGAADFGTGAAGAQTLRAVIASRSESVATPLAAQLSNGTSAVDYGSGASGTTTLRTVLATRHEAVGTPLAVQLSNGTAAIDYGSGASSTATQRVVLATRHEAVGTPLAVQLSNGTAAIAYDTGASGTTTQRMVLATRHEAAATPVSVRLSDGAAFGVPASTGRAFADSARNSYSGVNVTTGAWVTLIASTAAVTNALTLFDSSGQTLELGTGAAASETRKLIIPPGGIDGQIALAIPAGTRIALRAISATASSGEIDVTLFQ